MLNHDLKQRCEILVLILSSFILSADQKPGLENEEPDKGIVNCTGSASNSENAEGSTTNADEKDDDESDDPKTRATPSPDIEQTGKNSSHFQLRCLSLYDIIKTHRFVRICTHATLFFSMKTLTE